MSTLTIDGTDYDLDLHTEADRRGRKVYRVTGPWPASVPQRNGDPDVAFYGFIREGGPDNAGRSYSARDRHGYANPAAAAIFLIRNPA